MDSGAAPAPKPTYDDLKTFRVPELKKFIARYDLPISGQRKEELLATAHAAVLLNLPLKKTPLEKDTSRKNDYKALLSVREGVTLPDPQQETEWKGEKDGITMWPSVYLSDITLFLMRNQPGENSMEKRLLNEYKQGKAYRYFTSDWLKEIFCKEVTVERHIYVYLKARCTPSMKTSCGKHEAWVIAERDGTICSAYCDCTAGLIQTCNHVAGLLFRVEDAVRNGYTNPACTSLPCTWQVPSDKTKLDPKRADELNFVQKKYGKESTRPLVLPKKALFEPVPEKYHQSNITKFTALSDALRKILPNAVMHTALHDPELPPDPEGSLQQSQDVSKPDMSLYLMSSLCKNGKITQSAGTNNSTFVAPLTSDIVRNIESCTVGQAENDNWKQIRQFRITASKFHKVKTCKSDFTAVISSILGKTQVPDHVPAVKYGRNMEPSAKKSYEIEMCKSHKNFKVRECGIFLDQEMCYLGASPDMVVSCDCCGQGLLEVKCPYSISHTSPLKQLPSYMSTVDGKVSLKKSHEYYTQVQGQLGITGKSWCDFFVYTTHGHVAQRIFPDGEFWSDLKQKLQHFFDSALLSEIIKDIKN